MGSGYVIDHCVATLNQESKERAYQEYMAECARFTSYNTAVIASVLTNGKSEVSYIGKSFRDLMQMQSEPVDNRTSDEIIHDFLDHFGGKEEPK